MNARTLLDWCLDHVDELVEERRERGLWPPLQATFAELHRQGDIEAQVPDFSRGDARQAVQELRKILKDDVAKVSLLLRHGFPGQFLYYRPTRVEQEIFDGLRWFSNAEPLFEGLEPVGAKGFERYLLLNERLLAFARKEWPRVRDPQTRIKTLLYEVLPQLFLEDREGDNAWIFATSERYWPELDQGDEAEWSGHQEMAVGDLVFIYRTAPEKAITDLFRVQGRPSPDPVSFWDVIVPIQRVTRLAPIPFSTLRTDERLRNWSVVLQQFQGVRCAPVPDVHYNRLLELLPQKLVRKLNLSPRVLREDGTCGDFTLECDFSESVVEGLLKQIGLRFHSQYPCPVRVGHQVVIGRADYLVQDEHGPLSVIECKRRIRSEGPTRDLEASVQQAKSYSLHLGAPSFIVAAPEGLWVYSLRRAVERQESFIPGSQIASEGPRLKRVLKELRDPKS